MDGRAILLEEARGVVPHGALRCGAGHFLAEHTAANDAEAALAAGRREGEHDLFADPLF